MLSISLSKIANHQLILPLIVGLTTMILTSATANSAVRVATDSLTLWYNKPAADGMNEALPIGNGRLGGLVYGGVSDERIVLNEDSLWTGGSNSSGVYESMGAYQKFADIHIDLPTKSDVSDYRRDLSISDALAHVSYKSGVVTYRREYFVSHPAQVMIIRLTADHPGGYTGKIRLVDAHNAATVFDPQADLQTIAGSLSNGTEV